MAKKLTPAEEAKLTAFCDAITDREPKEEPTRVIFRKWKDGNIIALFPDLNHANGAANRGNIMSYMHVGQHGEASESLLDEKIILKDATAEEAADLRAELEMIGYVLN